MNIHEDPRNNKSIEFGLKNDLMTTMYHDIVTTYFIDIPAPTPSFISVIIQRFLKRTVIEDYCLLRLI